MTLESLQDRIEITEVITKYAESIDRKDYTALESTMHGELRARYGNGPWIDGGQNVLEHIRKSIDDLEWQHHLLTVYRIDIQGDVAAALVYHTSYQAIVGRDDAAGLLAARYHLKLRKDHQGWKLWELIFEVLWGEERTDSIGYLASVMGGRGPAIP